jgi:hypothetical protein
LEDPKWVAHKWKAALAESIKAQLCIELPIQAQFSKREVQRSWEKFNAQGLICGFTYHTYIDLGDFAPV